MLGGELRFGVLTLDVGIGVLLIDAHDGREDEGCHKHGDADKEHRDVVANLHFAEEGHRRRGGEEDASRHREDCEDLGGTVALAEEEEAKDKAHHKGPAADDHMEWHGDVERQRLVVHHRNAEEQRDVDNVCLHRKNSVAHLDHPPVFTFQLLYFNLVKETHK